MNELWQLSVPWWEFVLRGSVVYVFLLVFLRITGRRQIGDYAPFDLILLLILSNAVQNSMNAGDNSLVGGLISATTLMLLHWVMSRLSYRFPGFERLIDGHPEILIRNGQLNGEIMARQAITLDDLHAVLRDHECLSLNEVRLAVIETNGTITIQKYRQKE